MVFSGVEKFVGKRNIHIFTLQELLAGTLGANKGGMCAVQERWDTHEGIGLDAELIDMRASDSEPETSEVAAVSGVDAYADVSVAGMDAVDEHHSHPSECAAIPDGSTSLDSTSSAAVASSASAYTMVDVSTSTSAAAATAAAAAAATVAAVTAASTITLASPAPITSKSSVAASYSRDYSNDSFSMMSSGGSLSPVSFLVQSHIGMLPPVSPMSRPNSNDNGDGTSDVSSRRLLQYVVPPRSNVGVAADDDGGVVYSDEIVRRRKEEEELELLLEQELAAEHRQLMLQQHNHQLHQQIHHSQSQHHENHHQDQESQPLFDVTLQEKMVCMLAFFASLLISQTQITNTLHSAYSVDHDDDVDDDGDRYVHDNNNTTLCLQAQRFSEASDAANTPPPPFDEFLVLPSTDTINVFINHHQQQKVEETYARSQPRPVNENPHVDHHLLRVPLTPPHAAPLFPNIQRSVVNVIKPHVTRHTSQSSVSEGTHMHAPVAIIQQHQLPLHHTQLPLHDGLSQHDAASFSASHQTPAVPSSLNASASVADQPLAGIGLTLKRNSRGVLCVRRMLPNGPCHGDACIHVHVSSCLLLTRIHIVHNPNRMCSVMLDALVSRRSRSTRRRVACS